MATIIKLTRKKVDSDCVTDLDSNITVTRPTDTPNTGWNNQLLDSSTMTGDIILQFTIDTTISNTPNMIGLNSDIGTNASYTTIDYCFYIYDAGGTILLRIYENGAFRTTVVGAWADGDILSIRKVGTTVEYLKNGLVVYTSLIPSLLPLGVDSSFYYAAGFWGTGSITLNNISLCSI